MKKAITFLIFAICVSLKAQVIDFDGNIYDTVVIGNRIWLKQNIKSIHYADGTLINPLNVYKYNNSDSIANIYGLLYTYSAATNGINSHTTQGICPNGYLLPNDGDWTALGNYLGGDNVAGTKLKDTILWQLPNYADNSTGFSALPAGVWGNPGGFGGLGIQTWFWNAGSHINGAYMRFLKNDNAALYTYHIPFEADSFAMSCRCLKLLPNALEEKSVEDYFRVYPNPASTKIRIEQNDMTKNSNEVILIDAYGKIFKTLLDSKSEIDFSQLPNGIYALIVKTNKGVITKKIVVQH